MHDLISQAQPYLNAISAALSIVTLGFVINLARLYGDASAARVKIFEDRLSAAQEDRDRDEKWQSRERSRLEAELKAKQDQLEAILKGAGLDLSALALGQGLRTLADGVAAEVESVTGEIRARLREMVTVVPEASSAQQSAKLSLAKGELAAGRWRIAAGLLDEVASSDEVTDWRQHFSRGVAHANARTGAKSDLAALRAYNDAVAFAPLGLDANLRARLFTYRGAILKRLGRYDEGLADLTLARPLATAPYELLDNLYNLACVFAARGDRGQMFEALSELQRQGGSFSPVVGHIGDYFLKFRDDAAFRALVGLQPTNRSVLRDG
jgi:hypothetical protein